MDSSLYHWRKTIAGLMLFGVLFYALIPLAGMMGHRFLPPHEHFLTGLGNPHGNSEELAAPQVYDLSCKSTPSTASGERLVHSASIADGMISSAASIGFAGTYALVFPRDLVLRFAHGEPRMDSVFLSPPVPPPNSLTVS